MISKNGGGFYLVRGMSRPVSEVQKTFQASIHNRFDVEVIEASTGKIKQKAVGHNTICNQLWSRLLAPNSYFNYIHYGTGSGTPATSDNSLFSYLGNGSPTTISQTLDLKTGVYAFKRYIQLTASTAVGSTITEMGIAHSTISSSLCTHAMLKDMNGNPISIEKTDLDIVNIYATVYVHFDPAGYDDGSITPNRFKSNYTLWNWLAGGGSFSWIGFAGYGVYNGNGTVFSPSGLRKGVTASYDVNNRKITLTLARLEASEANFGGIKFLLFGYNRGNDYGGAGYPMIDLRVGGSWMPYSEVTDEAVGTGDGNTRDFALDFPFAHDARVYVNGEEVTEFTLDYGPVSTPYGTWAMTPLRKESTPDHHIHAYDTEGIFYNQAHGIGISRVYVSGSDPLYASNDLTSWEPVSAAGTSSGWRSVPEAYQRFKYWKGNISASYGEANFFELPSSYTGKTLHLEIAPPEGATITADYLCDVIAKDANHVFDVSVVIQLGEYTEAQ